MANNSKPWKEWLGTLGEISQYVTGLTGLISFLRDVKPAADAVIQNIAPEAAARIRRNAQRGSKGPVDDINFINTLLLLDGEDIRKFPRPLAENISSYLLWLVKKDPVLGIIFVYITGLEMDDEERFRFLTYLAHMRDEKLDPKSEDAHQARYEHTQSLEAFRRPQGIIKQYLDNHPEIVSKIRELGSASKAYASKAVTASVSAVKKFDAAAETVGQNLIQQVNEKRVERENEKAIEIVRLANRTFLKKIWDAIRPLPLLNPNSSRRTK